MTNRWKHFCVMFLVGDGMMAAIRPQLAARAWVAGPKPWRDLMEHLAEHPELTRAIGFVEAGVGLWWALQREKELE
jgi:uncharacterized protein YjeT (DUF2065 family)